MSTSSLGILASLGSHWKTLNLLNHSVGRKAVFAALYLSEGAPIGFIWWALPTWLRTQGLPVERITALTALLVLPWTFKFLWAPLVDRVAVQRGRLRVWIASAQTVMGLSLLPLLWFSPAEDFALCWVLLLVHAFAAATQDVGVDALAIHSVEPGELGRINGWMQAGMLLGRSVFGGGALLLAAKLGWPAVVSGLILCVWLSMGLLRFCHEPKSTSASTTPQDSFGGLVRGFLKSRLAWMGVGFALLAGAGFETVGALAGPYLVDHEFNQEEIGWFLGVPAVIGMLVGSLMGGWLSDRIGKTRAAGLMVALLAALISALGVLEGLGWLGDSSRMAWLGMIYIAVGLFTASSYALFMNLADRRLGATQFSAFMAATNGCEVWAGWAGGQLAGRFGYPFGFVAMAIVSLLGLPFLRRVSTQQPIRS